MVIAEPRRELLSFSFWLKMTLVVLGTILAALFRGSLKRNEQHWEGEGINQGSVKLMALLTLLIWVAIIILGRLIAYDHVWGSWSMVPRV